MKQKIISVLKSDLVKVTSKTGIASFVKLVANFIVFKVLAILVGPSGLAVLGQLTNVSSIVQSLGSGGITLGITKYIAEFTDDKAAQQKIINHSLKLTFITSFICTLLVLIFYKFIGAHFFNTDKYNSIILMLGVTLILFGLNNVIIAIINGYSKFKLYVVINIATSIVSLVTTIAFVYYMGVYGALLSFILSPTIVFFITFFLIRKEHWLNFTFLKTKLDPATVKLLGNFSLMAINSAVIGSAAQLVIRSMITKQINIDTAGVWDGTLRLSSAYLLLITTSIQVYYLPTLSYIKDRKLLWKEIIKTEKIIIPITAISFFILFLFKGIIVDILFSKEFFLMKDVLVFQLIGDLIKIAGWIIAYTMYAKAMTKQLIISDIIFSFTYVLFSYILLNVMKGDPKSVYYAYIINYIIYFFAMYWLLKNYTNKPSENIVSQA